MAKDERNPEFRLIGTRPNRPQISGLPGRMAIFQKPSSKPSPPNACWIRS